MELDAEFREKQLSTFSAQDRIARSAEFSKMQNSEFDFNSAAAKEMFQFLAHIDKHPTGSWSTHKENFYLETLKHVARSRSPAFINMHQIKLTLLQFFNSVKDQIKARTDQAGYTTSQCEEFLGYASKFIREFKNEKKERTLSEGKRNLMINLLQGLLSDIIEAQSPDQPEILQEILFKVAAISNLQNSEDQLAHGETEISELVQEIAKQIINLLIIQTEGLSNLTKVSKEDCQSLVEFAAKLCCYIGKPAFSFEILVRLIQMGTHNLLEIPEFYAAKSSESTFLLDKPIAVYKIPNDVDASKLQTTRVFADASNFYLYPRESKTVYIMKREITDSALSVYKTVQVEFDHIAFFAGSVWCYNEKTHGATQVDPSDSRGVGKIVHLKPQQIDGKIDQLWPGSKPAVGSMLAVCGDFSNNIYTLYVVKLTIKNENKRCLVLSRQTLKEGSNAAELVSTSIVNHEGQPWVLQGFSHDHYHHVSCFEDKLILNKNNNDLHIIDLETCELTIGKYSNLQLCEKEGTLRRFNGIDVLNKRLFSISNASSKTLYEREMSLLSTFKSSSDAISLSGVSNVQKIAASFGLASGDEDGSSSTGTDKPKETSQLSILNLNNAIFSLIRQVSNHHSFLDLNLDSKENWPDSMPVLLNQNSIQLDYETFDNLKNLVVEIAKLNDCKLNLSILTVLEVYLDQASVFQDFKSSEGKLLNQKTLFYLRCAVEKMAKCNKKKQGELSQTLYDKKIVNVYLGILRMTRKAKALDFEGIVDSLLTSSYQHDYDTILSLTNEIVQVYEDGSRSFADSTRFLDYLVLKVLALSSDILKEEFEILATFGDKDKKPTIKSFNLRSNLWNTLVLLIKLHANLSEENLKKLKDFSKQTGIQFLTEFESCLKKHAVCLSKPEALSRLDDFVMSSLSGNIFYRYLTLLMYDEKSDNSAELLDISKKFTSACKALSFSTSSANPSSPQNPHATMTLEVSASQEHLVKFQRFSMPTFKDVEIEVSGLDPHNDTLMVCTLHTADRARIVDRPQTEAVVVPHRYVHTNGKFGVAASEFLLVLKSELLAPIPPPRKITVKIFGCKSSSGNSSKIQIFNEICLQLMIESCRQTFQSSLSEKAGELPEKVKRNLTTILDSKVFYNGVDLEKYQPVKAKTSEQEVSILDRCRELYADLLQRLEFAESTIPYYDTFCNHLHEATKRNNIHSELLGELGLVLVKSVFAVVLFHKGMVSTTNDNLLEAEKLQGPWMKCNLLRVTCRSFEAEHHYEEFYNKIFLLCSVKPLDEDEEPPMSTKLNPSKSMIEKVAPILNALKVFFDDLKLKNLVQSKTVSSEVPELVVRFLSLKIDLQDIIQYLKAKKAEAEGITSVLDALEVLMADSNNISDVLTMLNQVFRKDSKCLDYLTSDYSGLSHDVAKRRVRSLQKIIAKIVDYLCTLKKAALVDKKEVIFALDSLKWLWRVQETYCVASIDLEAIIDNNWTLFKNPEMQASLVELCGSILIFCSNQFDDKGLKKNSQRDIELSNGVNQMITSNLGYLCSVVEDCLDFLDQEKAVDYAKTYKDWIDRQHKLNRHHLTDVVIMYTREIDHLNLNKDGDIINIDNREHLLSVDESLFVEKPAVAKQPSTQPQAQPQLERQATNNSGIGWLFEGNEEPPQQTAAEKPAAGSGQQPMTSRSQQEIESTMQRIDNALNALTHIYYLMLTMGKYGEQFLIPSFTDLLTKIVIAAYPESLTDIAMRVFSLSTQTREHLSETEIASIFSTISRHHGCLFKKTSSLVKVDTHVDFLRSLLGWEEVAALVKAKLGSDDDGEVLAALDILDPESMQINLGSVVYHIEDPTQEAYIVLKQTPGLLATVLTRDHIVYNYDVKTSSTNYLEFNNMSHKLLTMCLRTKNFKFFNKEEVKRLGKTDIQDALLEIVQSSEFVSLPKSLNNSAGGLFAKLRWVNVCICSGKHELIEAAKSVVGELPQDLPSVSADICKQSTDIVKKFIKTKIQDHSDCLPTIKISMEIHQQNSKFESLKNRFYNIITKKETSTSHKIASNGILEKNLYYDGKKEPKLCHYFSFDTKDAKLLTEAKLSAILISQMKQLMDESRSFPHSEELDLLQQLKASDLKTTTPKQLFSLLKNLKDNLPKIVTNSTKLAEALTVLFEQSLCLLEDETTWDNLYLVKSFVYSVESFVELGPSCHNELPLDNREEKVDRWLSKIDVTSYLKAVTYLRNIKFESLQCVLVLMARYVLKVFKPYPQKLKQQNCYQWLTAMNQRLEEVYRNDQDQDDIIIKGILLHNLQNTDKEFEQNPWRVQLTDKQTRKGFDTSKYRDWMFVADNGSSYNFALFDSEQSKLPMKIYQLNDGTARRDLSIELEFSADSKPEVFVDTEYPLQDYVATSNLVGLYEVLGHSINDDGFVYGACNILVARGIAHVKNPDNNHYYPLIDGITLANRDNYFVAMYRESSKELLLTHENSIRTRQKVLEARLTNFDQYPIYCIRLGSFPTMKQILLVFDGYTVVMKAVDGSLVVYCEDTNENDSDVLTKTRNLIHLLNVYYYGKMNNLEKNEVVGFTVFEHKPEVPEIQTLTCFDTDLAALSYQTAEGSDLLVWKNSSKTLTAIRFTGQKIKKIIHYGDVFTVLFESGAVYKTENVDFKGRPDEEENSDTIRYQELKNPRMAKFGKITDIYFMYRNAVIGLELTEKDGKTERNIVTVYGSEKSCDKKWIPRFTDSSEFVENPTRDSMDLIIKNTNPYRFGPFFSSDQMVSDYNQDCDYPIAFAKNPEGGLFIKPLAQQDDLKDHEIVVILTRPVATQSWAEYLGNYLEGAKSEKEDQPFNPEDKETAGCIYWSPNQGVVCLEKVPDDLTTLGDFVMLFKPKSKFNSKISEFVTKMTKDASIIRKNYCFNLNFFPNFNKMDKQEFDRFKEDVKHLWEPEFEKAKASYIKYKSLAIDVTMKAIENQYSSRSMPYKFLINKEFLKNRKEWSYFESSVKEDYVEIDFHLAMSCYRILNIQYNEYYMRLPIFEQRCLDLWFNKKADGNVFGTFFVSMFKPQECASTRNVDVNKFKAMKHVTLKRQNFSILNQIINGLDYSVDRNKNARMNVDRVSYKLYGEGSIDAGGPRRELIEILHTEIVQKLCLFIPTPNNVNNVGEERDRMVPNPSANSVQDWENFYKIGNVIGQVAKQYDMFPLRLPSCFWRYLSGYNITWEDYANININQYNCLKEIEKMTDAEVEALQEYLVVYLADGKDYELVANGKNISLDRYNRGFYVESIKRILLSQLEIPFSFIREGFRDIVPSGMIQVTTPENLEKYICGAEFVDLEILKKITQYKNFDGNPLEHPSIKFFWNILADFTQEELAEYLRFVWGRSRLGTSFVDNHKLSYVSGHKNHIPESHTCFFELDVFDYDTEDIMKSKLVYAIKNCTTISESDNRINIEDL